MRAPGLSYIDLPVGRLAYRAAGDGPPLLLIHGWGGSSRHWLHTLPRLAERHAVYAPDLPGFGESPAGRVGGLGELAGALLAFADALGLGRLGLAGHSMGAAVALLAAAARPDLVGRLALVSFGLARSAEEGERQRRLGEQLGTAAGLWGPWLAASRPWLAATRPWRQLLWTTPPLPGLLAAPLLHHMPDPAALAVGVADLVGMDALASLESAAGTGDPLVARAARAATMPALVLAGRHDPVFPPASAAALAAALPRGRLEVIDACGHLPMAEQPAALAAALAGFLAGG